MADHPVASQSAAQPQPCSLVAYTLVGEGLAPAFGEGEVIVADRAQTPKPGGRAILELANRRVMLVRVLKVGRPAGEVFVEHLVSRDRAAFGRHEVVRVSAIRATYSRGHAPRVGILEWSELQTQGGLR